MKTKIIPFDIEIAKKIQAGEIKGKIMCHSAEAIVIDIDMNFRGMKCICVQTLCDDGKYHTKLYSTNGVDEDFCIGHGLYIELQYPDNKPQFKPFDKVLVRGDNLTRWQATFFSHIEYFEDGEQLAITTSGAYNLANSEIIPYEGNENLIGTTDIPKEK